MTAVEALTLIRKSRDCRPNDGFLSQLIHLDNQMRLEREYNLCRTLKLSTLEVYTFTIILGVLSMQLFQGYRVQTAEICFVLLIAASAVALSLSNQSY